MANNVNINPSDTTTQATGAKQYELSNHLGNVLATITDKGTVISAQDYYPFGLTLASRSFTLGSSYRYSFNGKEDDKGLKQQDYGMRIYRPDLGRFLSVDPIARQYPELTPYQFASNTPIQAIDLDGLEAYIVYNKATSTMKIVPNVSTINPELPLMYINAFAYKNLTDADRAKANYGIEVKNVFTGGHYDFKSGQIVSDDPTRPKEKPIANGLYSILENKGNTEPSHISFFVLDPMDSHPYDKTDDRPNQLNSDGEKRTGFNLHPGGTSWGCVTVCKYNGTLGENQTSNDLIDKKKLEEWDIINDVIETTKTESVPDNRGSHKYVPFESQTKFGTLEVINQPPPPKGTIPRN